MMGDIKKKYRKTLFDYLLEIGGDADTYDTVYDMCVTVCVDTDATAKDESDEDYGYDTFCRNIAKQPYIVDENDGSPVVNWYDFIKDNLERFKRATQDCWCRDFESFEDEDDFIEEWIGELHMLFAGYGSEDAYRRYLKYFTWDEDREVNFSIYQIKKDCSDGHYIEFEGLENLKKYGYKLDRANYEEVYKSGLGCSEEYTDNDILEVLYCDFNQHRPSDFNGHSLSVSDVVVLSMNGGEKAYFCDSLGWEEVPQFLEKEEQ